MITILLNSIYTFLDFLIQLFPFATGFDSAFHTAATNLGGYLHIFDPILPINIVLTCLTLLFGIEIGIFGFRTLKWLVSHIPFVGAK